MSDKDFLQWIHDRLIHVYGENLKVDYLHRLRKIINATADQEAANTILIDSLIMEREQIIKQLHDTQEDLRTLIINSNQSTS